MNKTPLHQQHLDLDAKMVDFYGWDMPLHYGSQLEEHHAVRKGAGMFDVSHMTVVDILGAGGRKFLRHVLANDIDDLKIGQALYSCLLNPHGGVVDDLIVYCRSSDNYRLVLNGATRDKDLKWLQQHALGHSVGIQERHDLAMIAVQGPNAIEKTLTILDDSQVDAVSTLREFEAVDVANYFFARTGYTGEQGFEIVLPREHVVTFWQALLKAGVKPCGLGARDSLRLEAGMMLYGQDMNESTTPYESGLGWTVKLSPEDRLFVGREAILDLKQKGTQSKMVGLVLEAKGVLRQGQDVLFEGEALGKITSGGYSPTLEKSIAFARVPVAVTDVCEVDIRGKKYPVRVTKPRFVRNGKIIF